jgi:hypothetical protein
VGGCKIDSSKVWQVLKKLQVLLTCNSCADLLLKAMQEEECLHRCSPL